ncbi:hypothetical protein Tco_0716102 [Tanacetum coccineum]
MVAVKRELLIILWVLFFDIALLRNKYAFDVTPYLVILLPFWVGRYNIFSIEDEILHEKLLNVNLLIHKIEALDLTPSIPFVLENPSSSPIPVVDSDFLIEEVDTFLVSEDSIPPGIKSDLGSEEDIIFDDLHTMILFPSLNTYLGKINTHVPTFSYEHSTLNSASNVILEAAANATNSYSIVEPAMHVCFLEAHEMAPPPSRNTGTDIKEMDIIKAKTDKAEHENG